MDDEPNCNVFGGEACVNVVFEGELSRRQIMKEELINLVLKRYVIMWKKLWRLFS
jgi:hypothetical protein